MVVVFVAVAGLAVTLMNLLGGEGPSKAEERLDVLAGRRAPEAKGDTKITRDELFREGVSGMSQWIQTLSGKAGWRQRLFEESQIRFSPAQFTLIQIGAAAGTGGVLFVMGAPAPVIAPAVLIMGVLPLIYPIFLRKRRFGKFASDLPEALSLIARALRSGSSLAAGLKAVVDEMDGPVAQEFGIAYEQQNFGIPIEQCLRDLYQRLPNMDFKFFATAVVVQKQAGGDLSEVLDKISTLIRERFRIQGQVKALTGEGRISGVMLIALPFVLFAAVMYLNPEYAMQLFNHPTGRLMLTGALVMQIVGAYCIKKMVEIKI